MKDGAHATWGDVQAKEVIVGRGKGNICHTGGKTEQGNKHWRVSTREETGEGY